MNFLNRNRYFLLHILVAEVEMFSKLYNKVLLYISIKYFFIKHFLSYKAWKL